MKPKLKSRCTSALKKIEKLKLEGKPTSLTNNPNTAEAEARLLDAAALVKKEGING